MNSNEAGDIRRLAVVDDDRRVRELLRRYLDEAGFETHAVKSGRALFELMRKTRIDLVVLDILLSQEDGIDICRRLRNSLNHVPVLMLSAAAGDDMQIAGFSVGADDFMQKPFNPRELLARVRAILRRAVPLVTIGPVRQSDIVTFGPFQFDGGRNTLFRQGQFVKLSTAQALLLKVLAQNPGKPIAREKLLELSNYRRTQPDSRAVDVQIMRLRKTLSPELQDPAYVQTVWGHGYVFEPTGAPTLASADSAAR